MFFYVYQIVNKLNNKRYIGSRTSNIPPEEDLGYRYRSSSRNKEFIEDMNKNPTCYEFEVIKTFNNAKDKMKFEIYLHNIYNVSKCDLFYNLAKQTSTGFNTDGFHEAGNKYCRDKKKLSKTLSYALSHSEAVKRRKEEHLKELEEYRKTHPGVNHIPRSEAWVLPRKKCVICGALTVCKYCCSSECFKKFLEKQENEYKRTLSSSRSEYIKNNYEKICEINQQIADKVDQQAKGEKISKTKLNSYDFCRIIKIYDNFNNLRFTIGRNISCTKFCSENDIFCAKSLYHLLKTHTKLTKGKWVGWYAVEEKLND